MQYRQEWHLTAPLHGGAGGGSLGTHPSMLSLTHLSIPSQEGRLDSAILFVVTFLSISQLKLNAS
jgi:hypothetical protein